MAGYFVDTSALAKLYHQETGSEYVARLLSQSGSKSVISRLSLVEFESVLAIKVRTGVLQVADGAVAQRRFRADIARDRIIVGPPLEEKHFHSALRLIRVYGVSHGLRTLDALQLAVALDLRHAGWISAVIASDQRLCAVSEACSCSAIDPANPGVILS